MYSQGEEEKYILQYFEGKVGNLCDIGANDGYTFSNSLALIEQGWAADLIEPSPHAFLNLQKRHEGNDNVKCHNIAISDTSGTMQLYEGTDTLVSTSDETQKRVWEGLVGYEKIDVECNDWLTFINGKPQYNFISIDAEGMDWAILIQMDLTFVNMLCIEYNSSSIIADNIDVYCKNYSMKQLFKNGENLIYAK